MAIKRVKLLAFRDMIDSGEVGVHYLDTKRVRLLNKKLGLHKINKQKKKKE